MTTRQWVNSRQPQTLYLAQILMYIQGGMDLLFSLLAGRIANSTLFGLRILAVAYLLLVIVGKLVAAYGIANSMRWAYRLGVAAAVAPLALRVAAAFAKGLDGYALGDNVVLIPLWVAAAFARGLDQLWIQPVGLLFDIVLVALLLHRQSRDYQKHWFR